MKRAKTNSTFASIIMFTGGFFVGWPIGQAIAGGDPKWALTGVGAGFIALSIPLYSSYKNQSTQAVEIYNDGLRNKTRLTCEFEFYASGNRAGLIFYF